MIAAVLATWAFIRSPAGKIVGIGVLVAGAMILGFAKGEASERSHDQSAQLKAQLAIAQADLRISHDAEQRAIELSTEDAARASTLNERLSDYEKSTAGAPAICALDDAAAQRLRDLIK